MALGNWLERLWPNANCQLLSAPGRDLANPTAVLLSGVLMLRHLGEQEAADRVKAASDRVYRARKTLTRDVGGTASTTQFADAVIEAMQAAPEPVSSQ